MAKCLYDECENFKGVFAMKTIENPLFMGISTFLKVHS